MIGDVKADGDAKVRGELHILSEFKAEFAFDGDGSLTSVVSGFRCPVLVGEGWIFVQWRVRVHRTGMLRCAPP